MTHTPLNYALWLLGRRDRSVGEISEKLKSKECSKKEINDVIASLCKNNYLNDERFARSFVREKISFRHEGKRRIAFELRRKLISDDIITKELANIESDIEIETAERATQKWIRIKGKSENIKEKLFRHLASKGFEYDIIKEIIDKLSLNK